MKVLYPNTIRSRQKGFTLIEIIVASIIGAFVAAVAVATLRAVSLSSEMVDNNINKASEVRFAAKIIATDLMNLYRDRNFDNTKFLGTIEPTEQGYVCSLVFYTVSRSKARSGQPEGDVYEVRYCLIKNEDKSSLIRQFWPNPDKDRKPSGILTTIAEDIDSFDIRYFDGQEWQAEWNEDQKSIPEIIDVTIAAKSASKGQPPVTESFIVSLAKSVSGQIDTFETEESQENATDTNE